MSVIFVYYWTGFNYTRYCFAYFLRELPVGSYTVKVTDMTRKAVELALEGIDYSEEALFFAARSMANPKSMRWFDSKLDKVLKHGVHEFFTYK